MTDAISDSKLNASGGSAAAGGINFQAAATAYVAVYLARGIPLGWLPGLANDIPVQLSSETNGPGDDLCLQIISGDIIEVQVKRGLKADHRLWSSLVSLARGINCGRTHFGVLVVSPDSSGTVKDGLARDIIRLGQGRHDDLKPLCRLLVTKLASENIDSEKVCSRLRIITLHFGVSSDAHHRAAEAELAHLCAHQSDVHDAWNRLYADGFALIECRGQRRASSVLCLLASADIQLNRGFETPTAFVARLSDWVLSANEHYSVFGIDKKFPTDKGWIPLNIVVQGTEQNSPSGLAEALAFYHDWHKRECRGGVRGLCPGAIGRFYHHCVVVAGPGMGKSTFLKKLAREYARDFLPVLKVSLRSVSKRMSKLGQSFEEALFAHALDGSGLSPELAQSFGITEWVLLCDGLDECGGYQEQLAQALVNFVAGHSLCTVVVTTRIVGYTTRLLADWRHYEVLPLESDSVRSNIHLMLQSIFPDDEQRCVAVSEFAVGEIRNSNAASTVSRNPLLLGMALSLAMRGRRFGHTKEQLYEKLFEVISEIPTSREIALPPSTSVLLRFLEVLGWDLTTQGISSPTDTLNRCALTLASELGVPLLQARSVCDQCAEYWQTVGLLELVSHAGDATLTFIHKTFAEYAAGKFLASASIQLQPTLITEILGKPDAEEVLTFAGALGAAMVLCRELLARPEDLSVRAEHLPLVLKLIAEAASPPDVEIRREAIERSVQSLGIEDDRLGFSIASALRNLAKRFPTEVCPTLITLLDSEHPRIKLTAWAAIAAAQGDVCDLSRLRTMLSAFPTMFRTRFRTSLVGGLILDLNHGQELLEQFVLDAIEILLARDGSGDIDELIQHTFEHDNLQSLDLLGRASTVLRRYGREYSLFALSKWSKTSASTIWNNKEGNAASNLSMSKKLLSLVETAPAFHRSSQSHVGLLWLSAFFEKTSFWSSRGDDTWAWGDDTYKEEAAAVIRCARDATNIDKFALSEDARAMLDYMVANQTDDRIPWYDLVLWVDAPSVDFSNLCRENLDIPAIERALHHKSDWIIVLGANILLNTITGNGLKPIIQRLLQDGKGTTLWAAAQLANTLPRSERDALLFARLKQPVIYGCQHIYEVLKEPKPERTDALLQSLMSGLLGGYPRSAIAAAQIALVIADHGDTELLQLLKTAFEHWLKHEGPNPIGGGTIPPSPRDLIVRAIQRISDFSSNELLQLAADVRSDVRKEIQDAIIRRLGADEQFCAECLEGIRQERLPVHILIAALQAKIALKPVQIEATRRLLRSDIAKLRYAAMGVLKMEYLPRDVIILETGELMNDSEEQIRSRAKRIIDGKDN